MKVDLDKTLEQLDGVTWGEPEYGSCLVTTCHQLRKKPLKDFEIEDLRIMIGQNINLEFLIPIAIEKLEENILAEGHFYEGDLLNSVLTSEKEYWVKNKENWRKVCDLFQWHAGQLEQFEKDSYRRGKWFENFEKFKHM